MKKFLALLFVCAGLTAMAASPVQVDKSKFTKANKGTMVMKSNTLGNEYASKVMGKIGSNALTPKKFFKENNLTPSDNLLLKKAPRRAFTSDEDVLAATYVDFRYVSQVNYTTGEIEEAPCYYQGGQGVRFRNDFGDGQLYCAGYYWSPFTESTYFLPMMIDYATGEVTVPMGILLDDDTIQGNQYSQGGGTYRVDTVDYSIFVDENWLFSDNDDFTDIKGQMLDDGSIILEEENGYVYTGYRAVVTKRRTSVWTNTWTVVSSDTTRFTYIFNGTQFLVANGNHNFGYKGSSATETKLDYDVYMFQADDTTAVVFNLWGFGMPGCVMYIYEDGTMNFPPQYVYDDIDDGTDFANGDFELTESGGFIFDDEGYVDGFNGYGNAGNVTRDAITWPATVLTSAAGQLFYPFLNNVLTFTNGDYFLLGKTADPVITPTVTDDAVIVTATAAEGAVVILVIYDDEGNPTIVDNPYEIERTDEDQVFVFGAIAMEDGKNESELVILEVEVPAIEAESPWKLGDVNHDTFVDVADVSALIGYILGNMPEVFYIEEANVDQDADSVYDVGDVTALISLILNN